MSIFIMTKNRSKASLGEFIIGLIVLLVLLALIFYFLTEGGTKAKVIFSIAGGVLTYFIIERKNKPTG